MFVALCAENATGHARLLAVPRRSSLFGPGRRPGDYTPELSTFPGSGELAILRSISRTRSLSSLISLR